MSNTTQKISHHKALLIATSIKRKLAEHCDRIEIAGSIRREKPEIGDIEIVAISKGQELYKALDERLADGRIRHAETKRWGERYRAFVFNVPDIGAVKVDVFIVTAETWGVQLMIRTGNSDFSRRMVTEEHGGGFMPDGWRVEDGRIWVDDKPLRTPEEYHVFRAYGLTYVDPQWRTGEYMPEWTDTQHYEIDEADAGEPQLTLFGDVAEGTVKADPARWRA